MRKVNSVIEGAPIKEEKPNQLPLILAVLHENSKKLDEILTRINNGPRSLI